MECRQLNAKNKIMCDFKNATATVGLTYPSECCTTVVLPTYSEYKPKVNWDTPLANYEEQGGYILCYANAADKDKTLYTLLIECFGEDAVKGIDADMRATHPQQFISGGGYFASKIASYIFFPDKVDSKTMRHELGHHVQKLRYRMPERTGIGNVLCEYHNILTHENLTLEKKEDYRKKYVLEESLTYSQSNSKFSWNEEKHSPGSQIPKEWFNSSGALASDSDLTIQYWWDQLLTTLNQERYKDVREEIMHNLSAEILQKKKS
ncbi:MULTISPECIES: hypothetical protein [unclassified Microcoleus]